jgi:hypothetical protein
LPDGYQSRLGSNRQIYQGDPQIAWGYLPTAHAHGEDAYGSYGMNHWLCDLQVPHEPVWPMKLHWKTSEVRGVAYIPVLSDAW